MGRDESAAACGDTAGGGGMSELTIQIPEPWWMSANDRMHWAQKAQRIRAVRHMTMVIARARHIPTFEVVHIAAWIQYPTGCRADPGNASPTVKACIDGLVDAGVIPDDDHKHVIGPDYRREIGSAGKGIHRVRLVITDQEVKW